MKHFKKAGFLLALLTVFVASPVAFAATSPSLGTAASFSVLGETNITNVPTSVIGRDVGLSPATGANYAGITSAQVGGTIYAVDGFGPGGAVNNPGLLTTAINDMTSVWSTGGSTGIDQACTTSWSGAGVKDLTTVSPLGPGVYCADAFILTGNLTLSGSGVWIFKSAATLTTSASSTVTGGDPCNVWWRLVSAGSILGSNSSLIGNVLSGTSINMQTGAKLNGRLLSQAAVTLDHNTITGPACSSSASSTSGTTTPGLPNTGLGPQKNISGLTISAIMLATITAAFSLRKKHTSVA
ncbi:MAG: repeat-containing protein [Candidatus Saccharibacteria bacterium]|nr:repeat-containing protein [Candidatus Saccharibacteria bacterium]